MTLPVILLRSAKWVSACWYPTSEWWPVQDCAQQPRRLLRQHQRSAQSMVPMDGWTCEIEYSQVYLFPECICQSCPGHNSKTFFTKLNQPDILTSCSWGQKFKSHKSYIFIRLNIQGVLDLRRSSVPTTRHNAIFRVSRNTLEKLGKKPKKPELEKSRMSEVNHSRARKS